MTDWILRGGEVIDGSGRVRFRADVAIAGERIAAVGVVGKVQGAREIDVSGKIVAPGFVDVHTHDDRALFANPEMAAKASQGVTTVVTGNCGISLAPLTIDHAPPPRRIQSVILQPLNGAASGSRPVVCQGTASVSR